MSNASRQAAYRQRHIKDVDGSKARLNVFVDVSTKAALNRLVVRYAVTQGALLDKLIQDEEKRVLGGLNHDEIELYYDSVKLYSDSVTR